MLEVIYRIYIVQDPTIDVHYDIYSYPDHKRELIMDCIICKSRDKFKELIRENYGEKISFRYSNKLKPGDIYCIIIAENCYNTERYFSRVECVCDNCGCKMSSPIGKFITFSDWQIKEYFFGINDYKSKRFCSDKCKSEYINKETNKLKPDEEKEFYIQRDMFTEQVNGYIYKITKKSTGEFYIGQTMYAPIFRWGQHLKTDRFDIKNILDYSFETLYIVSKDENILEVEKRYIKEYIDKYPGLSLNVIHNAEGKDIKADDESCE